MEEEPKKYRMVKHVFRGNILTQYCKFALEEGGIHEQRIIQHRDFTDVERNMYVDGLMKSVCDDESAYRLVE